MLYQEGPAATGPSQTGGSYGAPPGFPTQPVTGQDPGSRGYAGQAQPQPVTGQNTGYPNGQGYAGQAQPQPVTGQNIGYSYGQSSAGNAGPVQRQNRSGGGKSKLPVFIGVAAVIALLIGVLAWAGGNGGTAGRTTGVTDDGFRYEIVDKSYAVLTGYTGDSDIRTMPTYINELPVTRIADSAFAGASVDGYVTLPQKLETIGANAFQNCSDLEFLLAYSSVATESTSFSGCDNLWFVYSTVTNVSGWKLPDGVPLYYSGMETGIGPLQDIYIPTTNLLVGFMNDKETILLMDAKSVLTDIDLDGCHWVCPWALDNLRSSARLTLGPETLFPYELYDKVNWIAPEEGSTAYMWLLSCEIADAINAARSGGPEMEANVDIMKAAVIGAQEYANASDRDIDYRPNGSNWSTLLTGASIGYDWAAWAAGVNRSDHTAAWNRAIAYVTENYTGEDYSQVGAAIAQQPDGQYTWWVFMIVP